MMIYNERTLSLQKNTVHSILEYMKRIIKPIISILFLAAGAAALVFFVDDLPAPFDAVEDAVQNGISEIVIPLIEPTETSEELTNPIPTIAPNQENEKPKTITTPPPLKIFKPAGTTNTALSVSGVVAFTNSFRTANGTHSLVQNTALNLAAGMKLNDMFKHQYFDHVSPSGIAPSFWVEQSGYQYKATGENLALGFFSDDKDLVEAWMASPGHKANILNSTFEDIGVAVGKGMFDGTEQWLAVQVFGDPLPQCTTPSNAIKAEITTLQNSVSAQSSLLVDKKQDIESTPKNDPDYNKKVEAYNALVSAYNADVAILKRIVVQFNAQVEAYNACIAT